jgi:hypothetical protein
MIWSILSTVSLEITHNYVHRYTPMIWYILSAVRLEITHNYVHCNTPMIWSILSTVSLNSIVFHVISLLLLFNVTSLICIIIKRIIPCSSMYGITVYRSHTTMYNYEENKRSRKHCVCEIQYCYPMEHAATTYSTQSATSHKTNLENS